MTLPQPYHIPGNSGQNSTYQKTDRSKLPDLHELVRGSSNSRSNWPTKSHDWLSHFSSHPDRSSNARYGNNALLSVQTVIDTLSGLYEIYSYQTHQASFYVHSRDQQLSDDDILEMLAYSNDLYWGYFQNSGARHLGYVGMQFPGGLHPESNAEPHTFIAFWWPRHTKTHLIKRLRMLAREGCGQLPFWSAFVGAVVAMDYSLQHVHELLDSLNVSNMPTAFARQNHKVPQPDRERKYEASLDEIEMIARYLTNPSSATASIKTCENLDDCGRAFLWLTLGKTLWSPDSLRYAGRSYGHGEENTETFESLSNIADDWINLITSDQIEIAVCGIKLKYDVDTTISYTGLWQQAVELERWRIPADALKYLHARQPNPSEKYAVVIANWFDKEYANALAQKLIGEAQQRAAFVPQGGFRTALPEGVPLKGIDELCIWADGTGLWVLPLPTGGIFYWRPESQNPLSKYLGSETGLSAWNLTLAALWHDLVTEGQKVIVRTGTEQPAPRTGSTESKKRPRRGHSDADTHVLRLPSNRIIHMDGIHVWGTEEEIEKIRRQAHQVRGHRRQLRPGQQRSLRALENARRFNFILPDGYTFVRPYQTGLKDADDPETKETPILARGLASLILMSKDDTSKRKAA